MPRSIFTTATRIIWRDNCLAKQPRMRLGTWGKKLSAEYRMYRLWERNKMYAIIGTRCLYICVCVCECVPRIWKRIDGIWRNINCMTWRKRWKMKLYENLLTSRVSNFSSNPWTVKKSPCNTDRDSVNVTAIDLVPDNWLN